MFVTILLSFLFTTFVYALIFFVLYKVQEKKKLKEKEEKNKK